MVVVREALDDYWWLKCYFMKNVSKDQSYFLYKKLHVLDSRSSPKFAYSNPLPVYVLSHENTKKPPLLYQHVVAKHEGSDPATCFPSLRDFDPNDPKGEKAAAAEKAKKAAAAKKKKAKDNAAGLDDLLSAGLKKGKNKK